MAEIRAVGAVAIRSGALLLVRRAHPPDAGRWSLPGGRVEAGETDRDAVIREVAEETGLTVQVGELLGEVTRDGPDAVTYLIRDYAVEIVGGVPEAGDDAAALAWVPLGRLAGHDLSRGLLDALARWGVLGGSAS